MKELLARVSAYWEGLSARERRLVSALGATALVFVLWFGVAIPISSASTRATERVAAAERDLELTQRLHRDYQELNGRLSKVEQRIRSGPKGEIFTTLESMARQSAVNVDSMEPRTAPANDDFKETKVQVALKGVSLAQLVSYLDRIESAPQLLSIKSLRIRTRSDKPELLDVSFTVSSFEPI